MDSIRKIFTSLDFGGRCIKNVKIDDQPYYVPFSFNDDNKNNPVPQEVIKTIASMFSSTIDTDKLPVFYLYFGEIPIPQASVLIQCDVAGTDVETILFLSLADEIDDINASIVKSAKQLMIDGRDGSWELTELPFSSGGGGSSEICVINLNNYTADQFAQIKSDVQDGKPIFIDMNGGVAQAIPYNISSSSITFNVALMTAYKETTYSYNGVSIGYIFIKITNDDTAPLNMETPIVVDLKNTGDGTKFLSDDGKYKEIKSGASFYTLDLNNYTTNVFNELSAMTLGTTIQVIDVSGRPGLYQIADHEPDYVTINSYMRYDDDDEDPEILSYTLRANGAIAGPTVRIRLETMGGGEKFLSDLGRYKEIKIPELINAKVTQAEYNAMESAGTLDNNTIYYIMG